MKTIKTNTTSMSRRIKRKSRKENIKTILITDESGGRTIQLQPTPVRVERPYLSPAKEITTFQKNICGFWKSIVN